MLSIIGIVMIVVFTVQVYKTAKNTGRNAVLWMFITLAIGIGIQWVLPFIIGIVLAIYWVASGSDPSELQEKLNGPALVIGIVCLIASFVGVWLVMRYVSKVPDIDPRGPIAPPPPPTF
jgi:putative Mn2+ efflux pump MntP